MEKWLKYWEENKLRWHKDQVDPFLIKYLEKLGEQDDAQAQPTPNTNTFFVPLCGKTKDLAYILSRDYHVFAVEGVQKAIETLNEENDFQLEYCEQDSTYRGLNGKIQIYFGDLFTCPIEKWAPFHFVWDKGSLTAIEEYDRPLYKEVIQRSLQTKTNVDNNRIYNEFKYLLRTVIYDKSNWDGKGPKCVSETDLEQLYGDWTSIALLESCQLPKGHILRRNVNIGLICHENVYLLTPKQ